MRVYSECFTGSKKIKQRRVSFVLGYLRIIKSSGKRYTTHMSLNKEFFLVLICMLEMKGPRMSFKIKKKYELIVLVSSN
jgi:hypothetical protein